jgi:methylenetetrahydrofolate dehydrogenase (NADP+) / methenyltetrahydrofolate cyclohydrolase
MLGYILMGSIAESEMYVKFKTKACEQLGIEYRGHHLPTEATQEEVNRCVREMSEDNRVNGILV